MNKKIDLDNGLRIVLNHMPGRESAVIGIWIAAGSRNETRGLCGISHFLEHMVFKGTPTRSSWQIKEEIEGRGGSLNGFTSEEVTCYLSKVSGQHIDIALDVLSDMALNARIDRRGIERERTVIVEEIKMYRDLPHHHVHDILYGLMWPSHPLGFPVAGSIKSVNSITRQDLLRYKDEEYIPQNIVVVLCGNLKKDSFIKKIDKIFSLRAKGGMRKVAEFKNNQSRPKLEVFYKETEQTRLSMGVHTFGRMHKDRYALSLLHIVLGANMSSRLFENIREKRGLAYEIGTEVKRHQETGAFIVNAGVEHGKIKEAISLVIEELKQIKTKGIISSELKRAKEFFKVQFLLMLEDTMDNMLWLGDYVSASNKLPDRNIIMNKVNAISVRDLQRVAKDIFADTNLNLAVVGPIKDKEAKLIEKELKEL